MHGEALLRPARIRQRIARRPILAALVLAACGDTTPPGFSSGPAVTSVSESTSGSSSSGDTSSTGPADNSTSSSDTSSTGTQLDVGAETDFGTGQPPGCMGKVDLLFLIARNGNMKFVQEQFLASFPGFVQTIEERLDGYDVHIMAANPDDVWPGFACETSPMGCPMHWPHCTADDENWICNESVDEWQPCDSELGAGITLAITAFPPKEGEPLDPECIYDDSNSGNYLSLLEMFPYHLRGDACADTHVSFFDDAVSMIDEACGSFVPQ